MAINLANPVNWQHPLNRGLVSRWCALGSPVASGQYWRDLTNRYNGTLTNAPVWQTTRAPGASPAITCSSGADSRVDCGNITQLNGVTYASIAAWVYRASTGETAGFGRASSSTVGLDRFSIIWYTDGNVYVNVDTGAGAAYGYVALSGTGWHHIAIIYDGSLSGWSRTKVYIDGVYTSWVATSSTPPSTLPSTSGAYAFGRDSTNRATSGAYDCGAVWARALSDDEVYREYTASKSGYLGVLNHVKRNPLIYQPAAGSFKVAWARNANTIIQPLVSA